MIAILTAGMTALVRTLGEDGTYTVKAGGATHTLRAVIERDIAAPVNDMSRRISERRTVLKITSAALTAASNIAFSRNSILLATRLPAVPTEGDLASDRMTVTDPNSGLTMDFAVYPGYMMNVYHVSVAWGVTVIKPEHCAVLLG